jgi:predicted RNA-binding Zn-ribbon protein involved in translation (DUF1610 family)
VKKCPFCLAEIPDKAKKCQHCGEWVNEEAEKVMVKKPLRGEMECPYCGEYTVGRIRGLQGFGEVISCMILYMFLIVPGVIYYVYMESVPYCSSCGRRIFKKR